MRIVYILFVNWSWRIFTVSWLVLPDSRYRYCFVYYTVVGLRASSTSNMDCLVWHEPIAYLAHNNMFW